MAREVRIQYQGAIYHVMSRGTPRKNLPRGSRSHRIPTGSRRGLRTHRLANPRMGHHAESFSSARRNSAGKFGCGNEVVTRHLHDAIQSPARAHRTLVRRTLQSASSRSRRGQLSSNGCRLHSPQPSQSKTDRIRATFENLPMEQLAIVFVAVVVQANLAPGRSRDGRARNFARHLSRAAGA